MWHCLRAGNINASHKFPPPHFQRQTPVLIKLVFRCTHSAGHKEKFNLHLSSELKRMPVQSLNFVFLFKKDSKQQLLCLLWLLIEGN